MVWAIEMRRQKTHNCFQVEHLPFSFDKHMLAKQWCLQWVTPANCARAMFVVRIYSSCISIASNFLKVKWDEEHVWNQEDHLNGVDVVFRFDSMVIIGKNETTIADLCDVGVHWLCFNSVDLRLVTTPSKSTGNGWYLLLGYNKDMWYR